MKPSTPVSFGDLDRRTKPVKRAKFLEEGIVRSLGGVADAVQLAGIRRVAELIVISETARARYYGGVEGATVDDIVRAENALNRAITAVNLPAAAKAEPADPAAAARDWLAAAAGGTPDEVVP